MEGPPETLELVCPRKLYNRKERDGKLLPLSMIQIQRHMSDALPGFEQQDHERSVHQHGKREIVGEEKHQPNTWNQLVLLVSAEVSEAYRLHQGDDWKPILCCNGGDSILLEYFSISRCL